MHVLLYFGLVPACLLCIVRGSAVTTLGGCGLVSLPPFDSLMHL